MQKCGDCAGHKHNDSQPEQQTAVVLDCDAEHREMTDQRSTDDAEGEQRARPSEPWRQQQDRCDQLRYTRTVATPRLKSDFGKDVNGFFRASEFEEQRLSE